MITLDTQKIPVDPDFEFSTLTEGRITHLEVEFNLAVTNVHLKYSGWQQLPVVSCRIYVTTLVRGESQRYIIAGHAACSPKDKYDWNYGRRIALRRALEARTSHNSVLFSDHVKALFWKYFQQTIPR